MSKDTYIFGQKKYKNGFGYHNVGELLFGAHPDVIANVNGHFGKRFGETPDAENMGIIAKPDNETVDHIKYVSDLIGRSIVITEIADLDQQSTLVVPYVNMPQTEKALKEKGVDVWGLPSQLTILLKNKGDCHELIKELGVEGFSTPDFKICTFDEIPQIAHQLLKETEESYIKTGMNNYPNGVMIRAEMSDGNYGGCWIKLEKDGRYTFAPEGHPTSQRFEKDQVLEETKKYFKHDMNEKIDNKVVVTRLIDLADSPGMSLIFVNGKAFSLGWNGQVKDGSACVGTGSYQPPTPELARIQTENEANTALYFENFVHAACKKIHIDPMTLNAAINVDWMIPGEMETEYQKKLGKKPQILVAETNPRLTNWTQALLFAARVHGLPQTIENLQFIINRGVITADKFPKPIPDHLGIPELRERIVKLDQKLSRDGTRVILRMPDNPVGVIFAGDLYLAQKEFNKILQ